MMEDFDAILKQMSELRAKKNADYGNAFLKGYNEAELGNYAIYHDLNRKMQRIKNLLLFSKENQVKDETMRDTLMDLAVISINAIIAMSDREPMQRYSQ